VARQLRTYVLLGLSSSNIGCFALVDFDGYKAAGDAHPITTDAAGAKLAAPFQSFWFQRGPASFAVPSSQGLAARAPGETLAGVVGLLPTAAGGSVDLDGQGGFVYMPPGAPGAFWGDDSFELARAGTHARARLTVQPDGVRLNELEASVAAGFGISGAAFGDLIGRGELAAAGDVNGDGLGDFILGAVGGWMLSTDDVEFRQGLAAYVLFGKSDTAPVSLADLSGDPPAGFVIWGDRDASTYDSFGSRVAAAGDVDGDGLDDVIIGQYGFNPEAPAPEVASSWGAAYVVFGKADGRPVYSADILAGRSSGFVIRSSTDDYRLVGIDVDGAGDVNGDGLSDVIVGAPITDWSRTATQGAAAVVFGKANSEPVYLEEIDRGRARGFMIRGSEQDPYFGLSVAGVGDVNGDGLADVVASSHSYPDVRREVGREAVVFGKDDTSPLLLSELETSPSRGFFIVGADEQDYLGAVTGAGDVNGDGLDDILVSSGTASFGSAESELPSSAAPTASWDAGGLAGSEDAGSLRDAGETAEASDAGPAASEARLEQGIVYVVFGKRSPGNVLLRDLERPAGGSAGFAIGGLEPYQHLGFATSAGDVNGDGLSDIVTTSPPGQRSSGAYVVFGKRDTQPVRLGVGQVEPGLGFPITCPISEDTCGFVASGVDTNGDGLDDVVFSSVLYPGRLQNSGGAYVMYGWDISHALAGRDRALIGGAGDDSFDLPSAPVVVIRGGNGSDTLRVGAASSSLDLTVPGRYRSIETVDLRGGGPQELVLDDNAVRRTPQNQFGSPFGLVRVLTVLGDADDTLRFDWTGFVERGVNAGHPVYGRVGASYGLEVSPELAP
jgi:hypothetical protein